MGWLKSFLGQKPLSKPVLMGIRHVRISLTKQHLWLMEGRRVLMDFAVSTAINGPGEVDGSGCTPRGLHRIRLKIGEGCTPGTVFVGRRPTGEHYSPERAISQPGRDWILSRILWLTGCELGRNRGGRVDTLRRFIYLHGTPDSEEMGVTGSHGCIRMRNEDIVRLFAQVANGTPVEIEE